MADALDEFEKEAGCVPILHPEVKTRRLSSCSTAAILNEAEGISRPVKAPFLLLTSHNEGEGLNPPHCCVIALLLTLAFHIHTFCFYFSLHRTSNNMF